MPKLSEKSVEALKPAAEEYCVWDSDVTGFGVRVRATGAKSFILVYRLGGKKRKHTMGRPDVGFGVKEARERARDLLRGLCDGIDPASQKALERKAVTVGELVDLYLVEGPALKPEKKAASWTSDKGLFDCHVKPLLGRKLAGNLSKVDVAKLQMDIAEGKTARDIKTGHRRRSRVTGGKTVAALTLAVLGAAYQFGIETGRVAVNPVRGVKRFKINRRERYLSERELSAFSEALIAFETEDERMSVMADAVRLLVLTGCRKTGSSPCSGRGSTRARAACVCRTPRPAHGSCRSPTPRSRS